MITNELAGSQPTSYIKWPACAHLVEDLFEGGPAVGHLAPALLHQLDALQGGLVRGHGGPAHGRGLLHLTDDLWAVAWGDRGGSIHFAQRLALTKQFDWTCGIP